MVTTNEKPIGWLCGDAGFEKHYSETGFDVLRVSGADVEMTRDDLGKWSIKITKLGKYGSHTLVMDLCE